MVKLKVKKNHMSYKAGDIIVVDRNTAHSLIDGGYAVKTTEDRQMDILSSDKDKRYRVK